jgi:hypothetical protein
LRLYVPWRQRCFGEIFQVESNDRLGTAAHSGSKDVAILGVIRAFLY